MKKIPTLFVREFENHKAITPVVTPGCEWVLEGKGYATIKYDGACCAIINGELYKRYDAKKGKQPPLDSIPCCEPDPVTGHWPHWVKCDESNPSDKWFIQALKNTYKIGVHPDGTYEALGPHFQGNPYHFSEDGIMKHGVSVVDVPRSFLGIENWLFNHKVEGIVFYLEDETGTVQKMCKIKRSDFGFQWP